MSLEVKIKKKLKEFTLESELNVETGCTGLMGPSGSGKSITLKCIAGVETADSGRIVLDGKILYDSEKKIDLPPQKRKIGYLFQGYALFPNMTIEENIKTGLRAKGFPALGIRGAAIATLIARIMELVLVCGYAKIYNKDVKFRVHYFLHQDKLLVRDFLVYSLPVVLNEVMWGLGTSANTAVLGHMGSSAVAANSVAQVARQLATVVSFGLSSATAIYLGKTIGERKFDHARAYAKRFIILSVVMGVIGGGLILIASPVVISFLSLSATARYYLKMMFYVMSYFVIAQAFNTTMVVGIFRSGGDTKFGLIMDVSTMWGCSILLGALAAFVLHWSVPAVYVLLMSDELIKAPITLIRYRSFKWLKDVTRDNV